jgi:hypothetical protein
LKKIFKSKKLEIVKNKVGKNDRGIDFTVVLKDG